MTGKPDASSRLASELPSRPRPIKPISMGLSSRQAWVWRKHCREQRDNLPLEFGVAMGLRPLTVQVTPSGPDEKRLLLEIRSLIGEAHERVQLGPGATGIDRTGGELHAFDEVTREPKGHQRGGRVDQYDIALGAQFSVQDAQRNIPVLRRVSARQVLGLGHRHTEVLR